jgi:Fe2+ transport system protein FeoA
MIAADTCTLADLKVAQRGRVHSISGAAALRQRLAEMGFTPGCEVRMVRSAPLGDPMQVCIRDTRLSLRRVDSRAIRIEPIVPSQESPTAPTGRGRKWARTAGLAGLVFFTLKGLAWLAAGAIVFMWRSGQ